MKKQIEIIEAYKYVHCVPINPADPKSDFNMLSLQSAVLPPEFQLYYRLGEATVAEQGKLFVFRSDTGHHCSNSTAIRDMKPGEFVMLLRGYAYDVVDVSRRPVIFSMPQHTTPAGIRRTWSQGMIRSWKALGSRFKGIRRTGSSIAEGDKERLCTAFMPIEIVRELE